MAVCSLLTRSRAQSRLLKSTMHAPPVQTYRTPEKSGIFLRSLTSSSHAERIPPRPPRPSAAPHISTTSLQASPVFQAKRRSKRRSFSSRQALASPSPAVSGGRAWSPDVVRDCRSPLLSSKMLDSGRSAMGGEAASTPPMSARFLPTWNFFQVLRSVQTGVKYRGERGRTKGSQSEDLRANASEPKRVNARTCQQMLLAGALDRETGVSVWSRLSKAASLTGG